MKQKLRRTEAEKKKFGDKLSCRRRQPVQEREKVPVAEQKIPVVYSAITRPKMSFILFNPKLIVGDEHKNCPQLLFFS